MKINKNLLNIFDEIFVTQKQYQGQVIETHIQKLRELDAFLPPMQSFFVVTNTTKQTYEFVSKNFEYALGLDREQMTTTGVDYWFSHHHPDDLPIWLALLEDMMIFTMTQVEEKDRPNLTYTWNFRVKNAQGKYLNSIEHQSPTFFDEDGKPVIGIAHHTVIGEGEPKPIIGTIKRLNTSNEYETLYHKNFSQKLLAPALSNREMDIIRLLTLNNTSKQVAEKLFISHHTVNTHKKNIYKKLNINSKVELVNYCVENQLM